MSNIVRFPQASEDQRKAVEDIRDKIHNACAGADIFNVMTAIIEYGAFTAARLSLKAQAQGVEQAEPNRMLKEMKDAIEYDFWEFYKYLEANPDELK